MSDVELNSGEELCPECHGGKIGFCFEAGYYTSQECPLCLGTGKLDWVEKIVGKKKEEKIKSNTIYGNMIVFKNSLIVTTKA